MLHCYGKLSLWFLATDKPHPASGVLGKISLGEMAAFLPIPGGHLTFAERFVDAPWSFALGWLYCE